MTAYLFPRNFTPTLSDLLSVSDVEPETGCWIWKRRLNRWGYGHISVEAKRMPAYRYSWTLANGPIPEGMTVDHLCFRPSCVNPDHLRLLTPRQNAALNRRALATQCKRGHEFSDENTRRTTRPNGSVSRYCRECERVRRLVERAA